MAEDTGDLRCIEDIGMGVWHRMQEPYGMSQRDVSSKRVPGTLGAAVCCSVTHTRGACQGRRNATVCRSVWPTLGVVAGARGPPTVLTCYKEILRYFFISPIISASSISVSIVCSTAPFSTNNSYSSSVAV